MITIENDRALGNVVDEKPRERRDKGIGSGSLSLKICPYHQERLAVVYVRQSSPQQVLENRESTDRQYALADRAVELGWPRDRVLVIDEDQGQSGRSAEGRAGFQRLLVEVNLDHVGLILGLEMSRLARSNKDWHHLLEVCAIFRTLLADSDGLYDPNDPNDRMLLGLKGTISEVELHTLRNRLNQGLLNKARRGELFTSVPIGYVRNADTVVLDPDEQVQSVVRLIFDKFQELRSASGVLRYLVQNQIRLGVRRCNGCTIDAVEWVRPGYSTLLNLLRNPTYAGAYTIGRRTSDPRRKGPTRRKPVTVTMDEWKVLLHDAVPAYITWDQYLANRATLTSNHSRMNRLGSARKGRAILPGLLICGYCGARMVVQYKYENKDTNRFDYVCAHRAIGFGEPRCQSVQGNPLEDLVCDKVLRALEPAALELSLQAAGDIEQERARLHKHWQQRLERARYETDRSTRQYHAVEPENRLVGRELEKRWEAALHELRKLEEDYDRFQREQPQALSAEDVKRIQMLAADVPRIWRASETTPQDRKAIVRQLIERVVVKGSGSSEYVELTIHWAGGYVSQHEVMRHVSAYHRLRDFDRLRERILELREEGRSFPQIAQQLVEDGFHCTTGEEAFTVGSIRLILNRHCQSERGSKGWGSRRFVQANEWFCLDLSRETGIPTTTLDYWRKQGWLHARKMINGRWIYWADADELRRLRKLRACPRNRYAPEPAYPAELTTPKPRLDRFPKGD